MEVDAISCGIRRDIGSGGLGEGGAVIGMLMVTMTSSLQDI